MKYHLFDYIILSFLFLFLIYYDSMRVSFGIYFFLLSNYYNLFTFYIIYVRPGSVWLDTSLDKTQNDLLAISCLWLRYNAQITWNIIINLNSYGFVFCFYIFYSCFFLFTNFGQKQQFWLDLYVSFSPDDCFVCIAISVLCMCCNSLFDVLFTVPLYHYVLNEQQRDNTNNHT